jgi:serine O-acetyltransferase
MDCEQNQIVDELLKSYQEGGGINNIDGANLPSKGAIPGICEDLLRVLFPGFLEEHALCSSETDLVIRERIAGLMERMRNEVRRSLRSEAPDADAAMTGERAYHLVCEFLKSLPAVRRVLSTDVQAAYDGEVESRDYLVVSMHRGHRHPTSCSRSLQTEDSAASSHDDRMGARKNGN